MRQVTRLAWPIVCVTVLPIQGQVYTNRVSWSSAPAACPALGHCQRYAHFIGFSFKAKIANAEELRVHTMLVIGGRDMEAGAVSVRLHHGGPQGAKPKGEVIANILTAIRERRG